MDGTEKQYPSDALVQTIVAEVMKKLQEGDTTKTGKNSIEPPSSESMHQKQLPDEPVMKFLVQDAQEKLASKGRSQPSASHPNDWIVELLKPPSSAAARVQKELETVSKSTEPYENWLRMANDDPPEADNLSGSIPQSNPQHPYVKRSPIDPPVSDQKMSVGATSSESNADGLKAKTDKSEDPGTLNKPLPTAAAGAYRIRAATAPAPPEDGAQANNLQGSAEQTEEIRELVSSLSPDEALSSGDTVTGYNRGSPECAERPGNEEIYSHSRRRLGHRRRRHSGINTSCRLSARTNSSWRANHS